jgi:Subtilase family
MYFIMSINNVTRCLHFLIVLHLMTASLASAQPVTADPVTLLRTAIDLACAATTQADLDAMAQRLSHTSRLEQHLNINGSGWQRRFVVPDGRLIVERIAPHGYLHHISIRYDVTDGNRPVLLAMANFTCTIHTARRLTYDERGNPTWIEHLDAAFNPTGEREPLNPPVPVRQDPGGVSVALVDTGINYLLPAINARLARDPAGRLLGYDYWEMDRQPFDAHPVRSAFFPGRHGTQTASLLLAEAPVVRLLPYRYPRPDMNRMAVLVEDAALHGVKLMNLSLVSRSHEEWLPFYKAARRHPDILFIVAAGNEGDNIDLHPVYPAALPLENMITVTSATASGHLAPGVNWGPHHVDLMAQAEEVLVTDFEGHSRFVSGSSYATVRVTALAACLLADHPTWRAPELKAALFARAQPAAEAGQVAQGFLPHPLPIEHGVCKAQRPASGI